MDDPGANTETIVAVATPPGKGGISIVRLSGKAAQAIGESVVSKPFATSTTQRRAVHADFLDAQGRAIDNGIALFFSAPNSFTGEDVLELQGHGSPIVSQMLVRRCIELGARMARPGEYSERAYLNGQLDLAQAEAVSDLIESSTEAAARSAMKSLQGDFSAKVHNLIDEVTRLRIFVEAAIDFPDEEIDFLEDARVVDQLYILSTLFEELRVSIKQGKLLRDGLKVVLTGLPNAGKSSLLNQLANDQRAIVSAIPGTTRDILDQQIEIDGLPVEIVDTAGIRDSKDEIEVEGVRRALAAQQQADLLILVVDDQSTDQLGREELVQSIDFSGPRLVVRNKIDLTSKKAIVINDEVHLSALHGSGIDLLRERIKQYAGFRSDQDNQFIARERHIDALNRAENFLNQGLLQQEQFQAGELLADDLNSCQKALGEITGEISSDELLGLIFGSFCIGK